MSKISFMPSSILVPSPISLSCLTHMKGIIIPTYWGHILITLVAFILKISFVWIHLWNPLSNLKYKGRKLSKDKTCPSAWAWSKGKKTGETELCVCLPSDQSCQSLREKDSNKERVKKINNFLQISAI